LAKSSRPGPKSRTVTIERNERVDPEIQPLVMPRLADDEIKVEEDDDGPGGTFVNEVKVKKAVRDIERKHLPPNRQMRTDVIFDTLHLRKDSPALLSAHGIIYNPKLGKHHLRVLASQRKIHKNG
jgi:hypothetical protein